ncbi:hypothetical protein [Mesorhizobium sp. ANAO-SY3R2]|uniref:hypothetical protein n=1 Tax=Mesorhizobium sp. ANAO-SY3R2 TaxID=3166644 RepID=UPI00366A6014
MIEFIRKRPVLALVVAAFLAAVVAVAATIGVLPTLTLLATIGTALVMAGLVIGSFAG